MFIFCNWEDLCNVSCTKNMISKIDLEKVWTKFGQNCAMGTTLWAHWPQKELMGINLIIRCDLNASGGRKRGPGQVDEVLRIVDGSHFWGRNRALVEAK